MSDLKKYIHERKRGTGASPRAMMRGTSSSRSGWCSGRPKNPPD